MENFGRTYTGEKGLRQVRTDLPSNLLTVPAAEKVIDVDGDLIGHMDQSVDEDCLDDNILDDGIADNDQAQHLAAVILKRIRTRLPGRVQRLAVKVTDSVVLLTGQCSTYYTKQLAQHAAMGVLDYQRLVNNISVRAVR